MPFTDFQFSVAKESTYGTAVTPTRTFEYESESIESSEGRTESDPLRTGSGFARADRFTPYFEEASGSVSISVLTKGFGFWLEHMLGTVATTGPAETAAFTHTATEGPLLGKSFTAQVNRPFNPSGTNQAFTFEGGKVKSWTLSNSVDENLMLELDLDFEQERDATALVAPAYPTLMENFTWAGGSITVGGAAYDVTEFSCQVDNGIKNDRRQIRGNTDKKEPTSVRREGTFSLKADFESLAQRNRAHAVTASGTLAQIVATWIGPTLIPGTTTLFPAVTLTLPACRFDSWKASTGGAETLEQELSGVIRWSGTGSPVTLAYRTGDALP